MSGFLADDDEPGHPGHAAGGAFTSAEIAILDAITGGPPDTGEKTVSHYRWEVAKLGGYLARANDKPPGNMVDWRGLSRLADILLGFELDRQVVGH